MTTAVTAPTAEPKLLARVRALVAKAESTAFEEEAAAFMAKAQELITRHSLDEALLRAGQAGDAGRRDLRLERPYASEKAYLLTEVAAANGCRVVWSRQTDEATVFGFPADLEAVDLLFTSLLVQATRALLVAPPRGSGIRAFRHAFLVAYAQRIGHRLQAAAASTVDDVAAERHTDLLPVLASRAAEVEAAVHRAHPHVRTHRTTVSDAAGFTAGRQAADRADLGGRGPLPGSPDRRTLG